MIGLAKFGINIVLLFSSVNAKSEATYFSIVNNASDRKSIEPDGLYFVCPEKALNLLKQAKSVVANFPVSSKAHFVILNHKDEYNVYLVHDLNRGRMLFTKCRFKVDKNKITEIHYESPFVGIVVTKDEWPFKTVD